MRLVRIFLTTLILTFTSLGGFASARTESAFLPRPTAIVAYAVGVDEQEILLAWTVPDTARVALERAVSMLGRPYVYASSNPLVGFDCSGLVSYSWNLDASYSGDQIRLAEPVEVPRAGDLVYYPGHIAIYLGVGDWVIHSANRRTGVVIGQIDRDDVRYGRLATEPVNVEIHAFVR